MDFGKACDVDATTDGSAACPAGCVSEFAWNEQGAMDGCLNIGLDCTPTSSCDLSRRMLSPCVGTAGGGGTLASKGSATFAPGVRNQPHFKSHAYKPRFRATVETTGLTFCTRIMAAGAHWCNGPRQAPELRSRGAVRSDGHSGRFPLNAPVGMNFD